MKITCDHCGKEFNRNPSAIKSRNYCSAECRHKACYIIVACEVCGQEVERHKSQIFDHTFCCRECAKGYLAKMFSDLAKTLNPTRMTIETRTKLRNANLNRGSGKSYAKTFGRHTHRIMAEQLLGRPLKRGEVVHHIDGDKRNNDPFNLMVFKNQAAHALWHKNENLDTSKNYE